METCWWILGCILCGVPPTTAWIRALKVWCQYHYFTATEQVKATQLLPCSHLQASRAGMDWKLRSAQKPTYQVKGITNFSKKSFKKRTSP